MRRLILSAGLSAMLIGAMALPASALTAQQTTYFTRQLNISKTLVLLLPAGSLRSSLTAQWEATCLALTSPPNNLVYPAGCDLP